LRAIEPDIERNLTQPDLSLAALAMRHRCTPRFIQWWSHKARASPSTSWRSGSSAPLRRQRSACRHGR